MLSRRAFLSEMAATGATLLGAESIRAEESGVPSVYINETLERIASTLKSKNLVADADLHLVDAPTKALVQWRWVHYRPGIPSPWLPFAERTNRQLFHAMDTTCSIPGAQLDLLLHECLLRGRAQEQIDYAMQVQRSLIQTQFIKPHPFTGMDMLPPDSVVEKELNVFANLDRPVSQFVKVKGQEQRVRISPLTRLGAGHVLSATRGVWLGEAECPILDARAEAAERSKKPEEIEKWVFVERNKHMVKVVASSRRSINHLIAGYMHDLRGDVETFNTLESDNQMSHLVLSVQGVLDAEVVYPLIY